MSNRRELFAELAQQSSLLERRVGKLLLVALETMRDSVADYYRRVRSRPGVWSPERYPTGTEKELYARKGMRLIIHATGIVTWQPHVIANAANAVGPNGTRPSFEQDNALFPIPKAGIGSLIMRIGRVTYAVGADDSIDVKEDGTVELMVNDNAVGDNSGSFTVHISL